MSRAPASAPYAPVLFAALLGLGGCAVRLVTPETAVSARFVCDGDGCRPDLVDDPKRDARAGTTMLRLPRECGGRFAELRVTRAATRHPRVYVACAVPEQPVGEMGSP
jgi:hypothetical protein